MDRQAPVEFSLDVLADPRSVRDVVRGVLNVIFFQRFFPSVVPRTRDVLDLDLPHVADAELETLIEQRAIALQRHLDAERSAATSAFAAAGAGAAAAGRGKVVVQFFERQRRRAGWLGRGGGEDEVCWESWTVRVTVAEPKTESERGKLHRAVVDTLSRTAIDVVTKVNAHKDHIPPITTQETNPFPYKILVDQKDMPASSSGGDATTGASAGMDSTASARNANTGASAGGVGVPGLGPATSAAAAAASGVTGWAARMALGYR